MMKYVYSFEEGSKEQKPLLGGKGANLAEMKKIGLPVPEGFTVSTEACTKYYDDDQKICDSEPFERVVAFLKIPGNFHKIPWHPVFGPTWYPR